MERVVFEEDCFSDVVQRIQTGRRGTPDEYEPAVGPRSGRAGWLTRTGRCSQARSEPRRVVVTILSVGAPELKPSVGSGNHLAGRYSETGATDLRPLQQGPWAAWPGGIRWSCCPPGMANPSAGGLLSMTHRGGLAADRPDEDQVDRLCRGAFRPPSWPALWIQIIAKRVIMVSPTNTASSSWPRSGSGSGSPVFTGRPRRLVRHQQRATASATGPRFPGRLPPAWQ